MKAIYLVPYALSLYDHTNLYYTINGHRPSLGQALTKCTKKNTSMIVTRMKPRSSNVEWNSLMKHYSKSVTAILFARQFGSVLG